MLFRSRALFLEPYRAAIDAGAQCIMVSFSSVNSVKMHANRALLTDLLKGELGFRHARIGRRAGELGPRRVPRKVPARHLRAAVAPGRSRHDHHAGALAHGLHGVGALRAP